MVSFAMIAFVYILAAVLGIAVYRVLPYGWQMNLLIADVAATAVTFLFSLLFKNASVYDPYWSVQPIVIVLALAAGQTLTPLRMMLIGVICLWGVALAVICAQPAQWYLCAGAAANTVLFLTVSIPMADDRQSAKPGFAEYRKQTRMLLPFPKHIH